MLAGQVTFTLAADGRYTMHLRGGDKSVVRPFTHRRRKYMVTCEKCRRTIDDGAGAFREALSAKERRFISGVVWCAKCVEGPRGAP